MIFNYAKKIFKGNKFSKDYEIIAAYRQKRQYRDAIQVAARIIDQGPRQQRAYHIIMDLYLFVLKEIDQFDYWYDRYTKNSKAQRKELYAYMKKRAQGDIAGWQKGLSQIAAKHRDFSRARNEYNLLHVLEKLPLETTFKALTDIQEILTTIDTVQDVFHRVQQCVSEEKGYYYTRMGDGEGSLIAAYDDFVDDKKMNENVYHRMNSIMFGHRKLSQSDLDYIMPNLKNAYLQASLLNVPSASRIKATLRGSWRGYLGVASCVHFLHQNIQKLNHTHIVTTDLREKMETPAFLNQLLALHSEIGLITCHEGLEAKLKGMGAHSVKVHLIPNQPNSVHGNNSLKDQRLYPNRDKAILAEIREPDCQRVYFVAAGVLGKNYCRALADQGHIAFDLGSAVDAWMGIAARGQHHNHIEKMTI